MTRRQDSVLLGSCAILLFLNTGGSALPNRTSDVHNEATDSNKFTNKDPLELQHNSSAEGRMRLLGDSGPLCAYRSLGPGDPGQLCFRYARPDFRCASGSCQQVSSGDGQLTANILTNGSVFIQWALSDSVAPPGRPGGFRLSCWWNGSYTQFECGGVHFGSSCRDYLLSELHTNVPYRICMRPYATDRAQACVEFSLSPGGMQDIVIAMTTVGGAICVMLVIICLLVAYITENIMNPTAHTHRSHLHTHL